MLIGNVGADPEMHYYDKDQAVARIRLATTEKGYTLQNGTQVPDTTDWHTVILWKGLAKIVEKYVHKGDKIYIEGKIKYRTYDDRRGQRQKVVEIYADNLELLSAKPSVEGAQAVSSPQVSSSNQTSSAGGANPVSQYSGQATSTSNAMSSMTSASDNVDDLNLEDSNIPF